MSPGDTQSHGDAPIEGYAAIGDGRTVALVAPDGSVDWWALPTIDAPAPFAALLDPQAGGALRLAPVDGRVAGRRYLDGTNVLQTVFHAPGGSVRVTDAVNVGGAGRLPWNELARRVEAVEGTVEMTWEVAVGTRFGGARPWALRPPGRVPIVRIADQSLAVVARDVGTPELDGHTVRGRFTARPGSSHLLALASTDAEPVPIPDPQGVEARLAGTIDAWRRWGGQVGHPGRWADHVRRSALALKLLIYSPTGAIVAAPTTSLPERIGGNRNYDYRFAWVRDMSFAIEALIELGLEEEVHASLSWLLATVSRTAPDVHVFYGLDGRVADTEAEVPLTGYRDSRPVRSGNQASRQTQLGTFGDLFEPTVRYVEQGNALDGRSAALLATCADRVCDIWLEEDSGLWELDDRRHYTSSKIGCWAALDRACRLADSGQLASLSRGRWELEREAVTAWVREHCWSDAKGAYTFHSGTDDLDAAVLLAGRTGFDRGERLASTIDAVQRELARGPLLYRYSGMEDREGAFLACSFWMVEALCYVGRASEAAALMDELVDRANDVGLLSEEMDPVTGRMLGNFPLALTHLSLINAACITERHLMGR